MKAAISGVAWVILGAVVLLLPAIVWGRPLIFGDSPAYWGWGRDIVEALQQPWPKPGQPWPAHRVLHGWMVGNRATTSADLRFALTLMTSRSAFYAAPVYLLVSAGGLWLLATVQALITAATLRTAVRAFAPASSGVVYICIVAALAGATSVGFETAYAMPDLFGGLAILSAVVLITCFDRLGSTSRAGLMALTIYAVLAHVENGLNVAAAALFGWIWAARGAGWKQAFLRIAPTAVALAIALGVGAGAALALGHAFGHPAHAPPFPAARVLADGSAQRYLAEACPGMAACDLALVPPADPEYYVQLYPLQSAPRAGDLLVGDLALYRRLQTRPVTDAEADHRERFVAEQPRLVAGAFSADGVIEAHAALVNGFKAALNFGLNRDIDSVPGLLRQRAERGDGTASILPAAVTCEALGAANCARFSLGGLVGLQYSTVILALLFLAAAPVRWPGLNSPDAAALIVLTLGCVGTNAFICGYLSGPYDRYQARVVWLIPLAALLVAARLVERAAATRGGHARRHGPVSRQPSTFAA
jgi:hypothetical protein